MAIVMTSSGAVHLKAGGVKASGAVLADGDAAVEQWINEAESVVNNMTRINYTDTYGALNLDVTNQLNEVVSNLAAIYWINHDTSGYASIREAENMIVVLRDAALRGLSLLRDKKTTTFIDGA